MTADISPLTFPILAQFSVTFVLFISGVFFPVASAEVGDTNALMLVCPCSSKVSLLCSIRWRHLAKRSNYLDSSKFRSRLVILKQQARRDSESSSNTLVAFQQKLALSAGLFRPPPDEPTMPHESVRQSPACGGVQPPPTLRWDRATRGSPHSRRRYGGRRNQQECRACTCGRPTNKSTLNKVEAVVVVLGGPEASINLVLGSGDNVVRRSDALVDVVEFLLTEGEKIYGFLGKRHYPRDLVFEGPRGTEANARQKEQQTAKKADVPKRLKDGLTQLANRKPKASERAKEMVQDYSTTDLAEYYFRCTSRDENARPCGIPGRQCLPQATR
ncbi:hypothetical protein B0T20DRAFT_473982 [Sordaria brevicollis]|uniref:Uncharacterized protein n=1 Tax=Sordaria brevicollis TaxID=83679 RepID=A0AAE0U205_SORBR|nr:hypothetical protein B0T20DRAFT_473982 [Sordaria brevicollis]